MIMPTTTLTEYMIVPNNNFNKYKVKGSYHVMRESSPIRHHMPPNKALTDKSVLHLVELLCKEVPKITGNCQVYCLPSIIRL